MATDARNLTQGDQLGPYRIERKLGEGGMGAVFQGRHQKLERRVAIKVMFSELARQPEARERFLREGRAAARIEHPNVVYVSDVDVEGEIPYLVMEYLEGEDLRGMVQREGPLSIERAASLLVPIMRALAHAHRLGIVHRDLKPENLFLARQPDGSLVPKILDFGISKVLDATDARALTATTALMGTPHYMSPEQAQGAKLVTAASDQYTVGVILYELVTGRKPYEEDALFPLLNAIVQGQCARAAQVRPDLNPQVDALIARAMALSSSERFASVQDFADALEAFAPARVATPSALLGDDAAALPAGFSTPASVHSLPTPRDSAHAVPQARGRRSAIFAACGLGLLVTIASLYWSRSPSAVRPQAKDPPSLPSAIRASAAKALAPLPSRYDVVLHSQPSHALFTLDETTTAERGALRISLPRDGRAHVVRVSADGYMPHELTFRDQPPADTQITLSPVPNKKVRLTQPKVRAPRAVQEHTVEASAPIIPVVSERKPQRPIANNAPILPAP